MTPSIAKTPYGLTPEFIFMLTRHDRTIPDALAQLESAIAAGVRHIGFKDVGLPLDALRELIEMMRAAGATSYLEVVSLDPAGEAKSAAAATTLGVDVLMGGVHPEIVLPRIAGTGISYFPFPGSIVGHPSRLLGPAETIIASARALADIEGVHGLDLLAYRFDGDAADLIARVAAAVEKPVIVAGSIDRAERICAVADGRAAAFTIGTAALDRVFPARDDSLAAQFATVRSILTANRDPAQIASFSASSLSAITR